MQANGGTLAIVATNIDNSGGLIQALDGFLVDLSSSTIVGGEFETAGSGEIRVFNSTSFVDPTNNGLMHAMNSTTFYVAGNGHQH